VPTTTLPACLAPGGIPCDDGDPCTDDACIPALGCENVPRTGLDAVTCTCARALPDICIGQTVPKRVQKFATRACRLFSQAVDAKPARQRRRLKRGAQSLRRAAAAVVHAQLRALAPECAAALADQFRDASDRAAFAADQI
jgi:hypothetical protein